MGQKIQLKRGNEANLPNLDNGEPALVHDKGDLYIGTPQGNQLIGGRSVTEQLAQTTQEIGEKATLPDWLQSSVRDVLKLHDNYLRQFGVNVRLPPFNAKGDGVTDDYEALQSAIDYGFDNNVPVWFPKPSSFYATSKPLVVYGGINDTDKRGSVIVGENREGIEIKKTTTDVLDLPAPFNTNSIMIFANRELDSTKESRSIIMRDIQLNGQGVAVDYGIYMPLTTVSIRLEGIRIKNLNTAIQTVGHNYLNHYGFIRMDSVVNGFIHGDTGGITSNIYQSLYVNNSTGIAYRIRGNYVTMINPCADKCTGIVYALAGFQGTVISPGSESSGAQCVFDFKTGGNSFTGVTACVITGANTWLLTGADAKHIDLGLAPTVTFIGGWINRSEDSSKVAPGYLYECDNNHAYTSLSIYQTRVSNNYAKQPTKIPGDITLNISRGNLGGTNARPTIGLVRGKQYWDSTLNKPIWYDGTSWRDATGTVV